MAERPTIERIAKILAKATSDNPSEAEASIHSAYGRMQRDGVTLSDLLSLPERDLYQDALVRLADHIVKQQTELSPSQKRALYAEYLARVVEKFAGRTQSDSGGTDRGRADRERQDKARAYEERRQREEATRAKQARGDSAPQPESRKNGNTAPHGETPAGNFDPDRVPFSFSLAAFGSFLFGPSSFIGCIYTYPRLALKLLLRALVVGFLTSVAIVLGLNATKEQWALSQFLWRVFYTSPLGFTLCVFITAYIHYERGWYPRGPRPGETDFATIGIGVWRLTLAFLWRLWGAFLWLCDAARQRIARWRQPRSEKESGAPDEEDEATKGTNRKTPKDLPRWTLDVAEGGPAWWQWIMAFVFSFFWIYLCIGLFFDLVVWIWQKAGLLTFVQNYATLEYWVNLSAFVTAFIMTAGALISLRRDLVKVGKAGIARKNPS